jgi:hypothetical protein
MDQAVKDRVGQRRITQGLMPVLDGQLAGDQRGPAIMAVFDDLQQVATVCITERREPPVIQDQQVGLGQGGQEFARASIAFRNRSFLEESGEPERERRQAFTTRLMAQRTAEPGFPDARRTGDQDMMMFPHPLARDESGHQGFIQAPGMPIVDIFDAGRLTEFGLAQAGGQPTGISLRELAVDQEPAAFLKAERGDVRHLALLDQGVVHTGKSITVQTVQGLRRSHRRAGDALRLKRKHKRLGIGWRGIVDVHKGHELTFWGSSTPATSQQQ